MRLEVPRLGFAAFRRRILFRTAFVLLILATLALAITVLQEEKQRSAKLYQDRVQKTLAEIVAKLRHPSGQLALLNPNASELNQRTVASTALLRPLLLPYSALDFADQTKAQQAVETVGCQMQYPDASSLCVAIGNSARGGGFVYVVGSYATTALKGRIVGDLDIVRFHRARITLDVDGQITRWIAPFEENPEPSSAGVRGRFAGFLETSLSASTNGGELERKTRPEKEFRAWVSQDANCVDAAADTVNCVKRTFYSIRLPVESYRAAIYQNPNLAWPPANLLGTGIRLELFAPDQTQALFDSTSQGATPPFSWADLTEPLSTEELLSIDKIDGLKAAQKPIVLNGPPDTSTPPPWWISQLIKYLPLGLNDSKIFAQQTVTTYVGQYQISLAGDVGAVERNLSQIAGRLSWFIGAMLVAITAAWLIIEIGLIRRITVLTKRAAAVSHNANTSLISDLEVADLRGKDELGILAGGLADLLHRVKSDVKREQIRAEQERDMWHAVGHEIMSPLQSLMVLHKEPNNPSHRYVQRMLQAIRVLYGSASPSEAIAQTQINTGSIEIVKFLKLIATNAQFAGITNVLLVEPEFTTLQVIADEYFLEDAITHILANANRYRISGSPIEIAVTQSKDHAQITISNQGPTIPDTIMGSIFEYGVSDGHSENGRGQGLFVAKTYMAKMQGRIAAMNLDTGVRLVLTLERPSDAHAAAK